MRVRFHLPDFAGHFKFNLVFTSMLQNCPHLFREGVEIASFFGAFPQSVWNGGRIQDAVMCDRNFVKTVIKAFNDRGIPLRFTFTNPVLEEKHLSDKFCNMVLQLADNGLNEAIVLSPLLEDYIRKNYPSYKLTSSTCKRITDPEKLAEELERDYHIVVLDYDFNNHYDILEKVPHKEKCELLINANCQPKCPRRSYHYNELGKLQIIASEHFAKHSKEPLDFTDYTDTELLKCPFSSRTLFGIKDLETHIKPDDIWEKYVPMGFEQFKIEGRTTNIFNLIETYIYYMVKPECADEARYQLMFNLIMNGVILVNE